MNAGNSCGGKGLLMRKPCASSHPFAQTWSNCSSVSTPSAVILMYSERPSPTTALMTALASSPPVTLLTKERSILIRSKGNRWR